MYDGETAAYLEQSACEHPLFEKSPLQARIDVGLKDLERYTAYFVVPWIEEHSRETLNGLIKMDFSKLICETIDFLNPEISALSEPKITAAWQRFRLLFDVLVRKGEFEQPELRFVGMFYTSIVLRNFFELVVTEKENCDVMLQMGSSRIHPDFARRVVLKSKNLPIDFNMQGSIVQKIEELPHYLDKVLKQAIS